MPKFHLRYFFDPGSGVCLWSKNDAARERFGYPVDTNDLPLSENTKRRVWYMCAWFDTSIDWSFPSGPSPWSEEEVGQFKRQAQNLLDLLREQLGPEFEIKDEVGALNLVMDLCNRDDLTIKD